MNRGIILLAVLVLWWSPMAFAGHAGPTGDADWDTVLLQLNIAAGSDSREFARHMDRRYGAGEGTSERLMQKHGFTAADACIALKLSFITHRPLDDIVRFYEADRGKGWGAVAKSLGIKPGSREFHELKNDSRSFLDETKGKGKKGKGDEIIFSADDDATGKGKGKNKDKGKDKDASKSGKGKNK